MCKETFQLRLKEARQKAGYKQEDVAKALNINRNTYTQYETGAREPTIETIGRLCEILEVGASWLLGTDHALEGNTKEK